MKNLISFSALPFVPAALSFAPAALPLVLTLGSGAVLMSACSSPASICALNDEDCDGVPDNLGKAIDWNDTPGPDEYDVDGDGISDGWAVDTDGDGKPDALGLDTNGDGYIDAIDTNLDKIPDFKTGDGTVPGGVPINGGGGGDGDGDGPVLPVGTWNAPVVAAAQNGLALEYTRWRNQHVKTCDGGRTSVSTGSGVVSEGIGYGMLITASLGTQAEFDAMHAFYQTSTKSPGGLMAWQCLDNCGNCPNDNSASDADLDAAMALLQAENNFGGGTYVAAARQLIGTLRGAVLKTCAGRTVVVAGEWDPQCMNLNPSYFAPGYYRAFAKVDTLGANQWTAAIEGAYQLLDISKDGHHIGNLMWPDGHDVNGSGSFGFSNNGYDACRVPWRVATDFAWSADPRAAALLNYVSSNVDTSSMRALSTDPNSAFYGALANAGLAGGQAKADAYYTMWINSNPLQDEAYYQATLRVIYSMLMAGRFPSTL